MVTLVLAVETATLKALTRLRDLLREMEDELATRFLTYRKEGEDEGSAPAPPLEEGLPLRFQTYAFVPIVWHKTWPLNQWNSERNFMRPRHFFFKHKERQIGSIRKVLPLDNP